MHNNAYVNVWACMDAPGRGPVSAHSLPGNCNGCATGVPLRQHTAFQHALLLNPASSASHPLNTCRVNSELGCFATNRPFAGAAAPVAARACDQIAVLIIFKLLPALICCPASTGAALLSLDVHTASERVTQAARDDSRGAASRALRSGFHHCSSS